MIGFGKIQRTGSGQHKTVLDLKKAINEMVKDELAKLKGGKLNDKEIALADKLGGTLSSTETLKELNIV